MVLSGFAVSLGFDSSEVAGPVLSVRNNRMKPGLRRGREQTEGRRRASLCDTTSAERRHVLRQLAACILFCCGTNIASAQSVEDEAAPVMAAQASQQAAEVQCEGVSWPNGFVPAVRAVELPSAGVAAGRALDFPTTRLAVLDPAPLLAEDEANQGWGTPPRIGITRPVDASLTGTWHDLSDGRQVWTAAIVSQGALEMRLHFAEMNLPSGAAVYVYSPNEPGNAAGPYAEAGLLQTGEFWSRTTRGDTAYIEYCVLDASQAGTVPFKVDQIGHVYRPLDGDGPAEPEAHCVSCSPPCLAHPPQV